MTFEDFCSFKNSVNIIRRDPAVRIAPAVCRHEGLASAPSPSPSPMLGDFRLALRMFLCDGACFPETFSCWNLRDNLLFSLPLRMRQAPEKGTSVFTLAPAQGSSTQPFCISRCLVLELLGSSCYCPSFCLPPHPTLFCGFICLFSFIT